MELLIRSQDKMDLIQYSHLCITQLSVDDFYHIWCNDNIVGKYKSKSRALEVLNEIQEAKLGNFHYRCPSNVKVSNNEDTIVYEMPKD